jgi:hypothetical protein
MALIENLDVSLTSLEFNRLWGRNIEIPAIGSQSEIYAIDLRGWVLGKSSLVVAVEVVSEGDVLQRVPINHRRPDIAKAFPKVVGAENSGFRAMVNVLGLAPNFELFVQAVLEDNSRAPIGEIRGWRRALRSGFQSDLQPLMLTTLGRAGSTWLMCILVQHPRIVAHRPFTYETRVSSYWMHILKALSEPASYLQPIIGSDKSSVNWWLGTELPSGVLKPPEPKMQPEIQQWLGHNGVEALVAFSQERIDAFYRQVAALQRQTKPTYFAEKHDPHTRIPEMIREVYSRAQEVILVRDFRDMVASILAYNAKRGYIGFGREHVANDEEYIYRMRTSALRLLESWRRRSDKAYLLRYEDLIWQPVETLSALLEYLELDAAPSTVEGMIQKASEEVPGLPQQHRTSPDADRSIGRWRSDLDPSLKAVCQQAFSDVLEDFGYE